MNGNQIDKTAANGSSNGIMKFEPIPTPKTRPPQLNGNGHHHTNGTNHSNHNGVEQGSLITVIRDAVFGTRQRIISEFDRIDDTLLDNMTIAKFSDFITRERLSSMPHRGSLWDRVLRWAEFYALQIEAYSLAVNSFVPESRTAAKQIYTLLRALLELGEENASALNITFGVFYKLGLSLSFLRSHETKLSLNSHIREDVGKAFNDIHSLVFDVAIYYQSTVRGISTGGISLDFNSIFRGSLNNFYRRKAQ